MEKDNVQLMQHQPEEQPTATPLAPDKKPWQEPKLAFVEPKLTKHGELKKVTGGFFGTFYP